MEECIEKAISSVLDKILGEESENVCEKREDNFKLPIYFFNCVGYIINSST